MEDEIKFKYEGKIVAQPRAVTQFQEKNKFGFKIENDETWYNYYQEEELSDDEFKKIMETDFRRGFKIQFNEVQGIVTDYKIMDRTEEQKKQWNQGPREDPKQKIAGMLISYAKDLVIADKIKHDQLGEEARRLLKLHQELSK